MRMAGMESPVPGSHPPPRRPPRKAALGGLRQGWAADPTGEVAGGHRKFLTGRGQGCPTEPNLPETQ